MAKTSQNKTELRMRALNHAFSISEDSNMNGPASGISIKRKPLTTILSEADKIYEWLLKQ